MAEYIEREATCKGCVRYGMGETLCADCVVKEAPAADVAPVVHGRWEYHDCVCTGEGLVAVYVCSKCKFCIDEEVFEQIYATNYCPNCGARMKDGE